MTENKRTLDANTQIDNRQVPSKTLDTGLLLRSTFEGVDVPATAESAIVIC